MKTNNEMVVKVFYFLTFLDQFRFFIVCYSGSPPCFC